MKNPLTGHSLVFNSLLLIVILTPVSLAQDWKPVQDRIMSTFGESVTPENAWQEYPRPQLQRDEWLNLNGLWEYAVLNRNDPQPDSYEGRVLVPFCLESALSGVGAEVGPDRRIWCRRVFNIPTQWQGKRVMLNFGAVDYEATVWINQALAGSHEGGFDPFSFDISDYLRSGENEILVSVWDPSNSAEIPTGKQRLSPQGIWYTPVSGIWQTVWLEPVHQDLAISGLRITPDIDSGTVSVENFTDSIVGGDRYAVRLAVEKDGREVATAMSRINRKTVLSIESPELWSPSSPALYSLKASLYEIRDPFALLRAEAGEDNFRLVRLGRTESEAYETAVPEGDPLDQVTSYFGMRKISLGQGSRDGQPVMLLNNEPLFHNGTLDQGWWPDGLHTPPSDEAMIFELQYLKDAGFNMLRKHIKVEPARYYYHCDRLGIMVWQDMPSAVSHPAGGSSDQYVSSRSHDELIKKPESAELFEHELRIMINRLYNHPSIVMWVVFNEGWGQYDTCRLSDWVRRLDPTRLVNSGSGWVLMDCGDIYDIHTYDPVPKVPPNRKDQAVVVGEYGGIGYAVEGHLWNPEMRNWGYQKYNSEAELISAYRVKFNEIIRQVNDIGISGAVYTQTSDVEGEVNGLLTYDRKIKKIPAEELTKIHAGAFQ